MYVRWSWPLLSVPEVESNCPIFHPRPVTESRRYEPFRLELVDRYRLPPPSPPPGDTLLTEMERKAADRFRERQKSVPFRLLYSASEGNETPHDLLDTRIGRSSVGKQVSEASGGVGS